VTWSSLRRLTRLAFATVLAVGCNALDLSAQTTSARPFDLNFSRAEARAASIGRVALVVGNSLYDGSNGFNPLDNPVNDAKAMTEALTRSGFDVFWAVNLRHTRFVDVLAYFTNEIRVGSEVVIFFSGHGIEPRGTTYLMGIDGGAARDRAGYPQGIVLQDVFAQIKRRQPRMVVYIIDACRENPVSRDLARTGTKGSSKAIKRAEPPQGMAVLYAAGDDEQALDRLSPADLQLNSLFTRELLPLLSTPGLGLHDLSRMLRERVSVRAYKEANEHKQNPSMNHSYSGEFYFRPAGLTPILPPPSTVTPPPPRPPVPTPLPTPRPQPSDCVTLMGRTVCQ